MIQSAAGATLLPAELVIAADNGSTSSEEAFQRIKGLRMTFQEIQRTIEHEQLSPKQLGSLLEPIPRNERAFKLIFDAYSDPVSYKQKFLDQNAFLVCK